MKLVKQDTLCIEGAEMVSAMAVLVVSSFCCPLSLLEVLFIALQHRLGKAHITGSREGRNNARQPLFSHARKRDKKKFSLPLI